MTHLQIQRMHGLGNVVLLIDDQSLGAFDRGAAAQRWCADHDADALIIHGHDSGQRGCWMAIHNADGSEAELCGNGLRCLVRHGVTKGWLESGATVTSAAGEHEVTVQDDGTVAVSMPGPQFGLEAVHAQREALPDATLIDDGFCVVFELGARSVDLHLVSTGNPHGIIPCHDKAALEAIEEIGPVLSTHPAFTKGLNVHLALTMNRSHLRLRSWERGAGATRACATGATGAVAALARAGMLEPTCRVTMPGGDLVVEWDPETNIAWNRGAAEYMNQVRVSFDELLQGHEG